MAEKRRAQGTAKLQTSNLKPQTSNSITPRSHHNEHKVRHKGYKVVKERRAQSTGRRSGTRSLLAY
jgi:hypothetical protein